MIVQSLLDNDFSRILLQQLAYLKYSEIRTSYRLFWRAANHVWTREMIARLSRELELVSSLRMATDEIGFLERQGCFSSEFLTYLRSYTGQEAMVRVAAADRPRVEISGTWPAVVLLTTPVHAICSEIASSQYAGPQAIAEGRRRLERKLIVLERSADTSGFGLSELGTRRRSSFAWQYEVNLRLQRLPQYRGSGNALIAWRLNTPITGLMHHDFIQVFQVIGRGTLQGSESRALESWLAMYPDRFLIALTDTLGIESFLECFDARLTKEYAGVRHDSGDPLTWANRMLQHYDHMGVDARCKQLVFTDGLTLAAALSIFRRLRDCVGLSFGVGTNLTNDHGVPVPDSAFKLVSCNGTPVVKVSDDLSKNYGPYDVRRS